MGLASYHVDGRTMTLPHTEIDPAMGGRGLARSWWPASSPRPASAA